MRDQRGREQGPSLDALAAYVDGEVTPSESAALEAQLAETPAARRRLARLDEMRADLAAPAPELAGIDLAPAVMRTLRAPALGPAPRRRTPFLAGFLTASAMAAVGAWALWPRAAGEFRARSAAAGGESERWAGIQAYRVGASGQPLRLGDRLAPGDGLVFSYTNLGARPFEYLMIFAVDARGAVRWFYPAFEDRGTDPSSVAIEKGAAEAALADAVYHDFAPGPLALYALFSHRPLRVAEVESLVGGSHGTPARLPVPDAVLQRLTTRIGP